MTSTQVLLDLDGQIAGFYTLATGQVDFSELPPELAKKLPRRALPVAVLAWLGVASSYQGQGLGTQLLARALRGCYEASVTFSFVAVVIDCLNEQAKQFYQQWEFVEVPGYKQKLLLSYRQLETMMEE